MYRTPDGYVLVVPGATVPRLLSRLAALGLMRGDHATGPRASVILRSILCRLAARSWPVATPQPEAGGRFLTVLGDRTLAIVTRPLSWNRHAVVDLVIVPAEELEVPRQGNVTVAWQNAMPLDQALKVDGGGLYIIERSVDGGKTWFPDYVGQTKSYDRRLSVHGRTRAKNVPGAMYQVRLGHVAHADPKEHVAKLPEAQRAEALRKLRLTTEHGIIRSLLNSGFQRIRNLSSIRPLQAVGSGLSIRHLGGPKYLTSTTVKPGRLYELEAQQVFA